MRSQLWVQSRRSLGVGIFSLLFVYIGGAVLILEYDMIGLFERIMLFNGQIWLTVVGLNLLIVDIRERLARQILLQLALRINHFTFSLSYGQDHVMVLESQPVSEKKLR
jgi:hypothetical protein